jgi:hypothetical protein
MDVIGQQLDPLVKPPLIQQASLPVQELLDLADALMLHFHLPWMGNLCRRPEKSENRRPVIGPETPAQLVRQMTCCLARRNEALDLGSRIAG